jgi:superfamily II DNA or RNA helicase
MTTTDKWILQDTVNFPAFIDKKYKKYKQDEVSIQDDPCAYKRTKAPKFKAMKQQKLIRKYIGDKSPYRGILVYHGLGTGKTCTAIHAAVKCKRQVVVLIPASLRNVWMRELSHCGKKEYRYPKNFKDKTPKEQKKIKKDIDNEIKKKFTFISHNAGNSSDQLERLKSVKRVKKQGIIDSNMDGKHVYHEMKIIGSLDDKLLIIDEVHNLLTNIINPNSKNGGNIYDTIMKAKNLKIIFLTGTPAISDPYELAMLFNMLRGPMSIGNKTFYAFPDDYDKFRQLFVDSETNSIKNKNIFQERISGLVSYYTLSGKNNVYPSSDVHIEKIPMSDYQWKVYSMYRNRERDEERKQRFAKSSYVKMRNKKPSRDSISTYRVYTRQASNFAFPENIDRPKKEKDETEHEYIKKVNKVLEQFTDKQLSPNKLKIYSPKMKAILDNINKLEKGLVFVYSDFLTLEGIGIFARVLMANGYQLYDKNTKEKKYKTVAIYSGTTNDKDREDIIDKFKSEDNKYGKQIRILLATSAGAEGLDLNNIRQIHIMEPYWNRVRLEQVQGRGIRRCSHTYLKKNEQHVDVYIYLSVPPKGILPSKVFGEDEGNETTDTHLFKQSKRKNKLLSEFQLAMKEMAFDCKLNFAHTNKKGQGELQDIKQCRVCIESDNTMYVPDIDEHILPGNSYCGETGDIEVRLKKIKGKEYGITDDNSVYDMSKELPEKIGIWNEKRKKIIFDKTL